MREVLRLCRRGHLTARLLDGSGSDFEGKGRNTMNTLRVGIASRETYKKRTMATARGEYVPRKDEPKVWFESLQSLSQVLVPEFLENKTYFFTASCSRISGFVNSANAIS